MLRVYYLPVETVFNTEQVAGTALIHHALLECTAQSDVRKLIMDTAPNEDTQLASLALDTRDPTPEEIDLFNSLDFPPPDPGFTPLNPAMGVEHRLTHVEEWLASRFPPPHQY